MTNHKIKLAFITPIAHLKYAEDGDILYVLSHMLTDETYVSYVKNSKMYKKI